MRFLRWWGLVVACAVVAAACGPRFDRAELVGAPPGSGGRVGAPGIDASSDDVFDEFDDGLGEFDPGGEDIAGFEPGGDPQDPADGQAPSGGGDGGGAPPAGGAGGAGGGGAAGPREPGPAPGVGDETLKIGYLVPLTGAAPLPTTWDEGARLYWEWKAGRGGTHGRKVELVIEDTTSSTTEAVNKARKLVTQDRVFTIVTLDRLEVQDAVARFLEGVGMPHVMVQSPASPPATWTNTFVISIDHAVQGRAVARFWASELGAGDRKVGFVREQTNALKPGTDAFQAEAAGLGLDVVATETIDPNQTDFTQTVLRLENSQAEIVWLYMAPTPAARIIGQAGGQGYRPTWFANSISWGFELMHTATLGFMEGAYAFSPWVPLSDPRTATYRQAWRDCSSCDGQADDIGLVGWGVGGVIDAALQQAGRDLGWDTWRAALRGLRIETDVWVPIDFTRGSVLGTSSVAVYKAEGGRWVTVDGFRNF